MAVCFSAETSAVDPIGSMVRSRVTLTTVVHARQIVYRPRGEKHECHDLLPGTGIASSLGRLVIGPLLSLTAELPQCTSSRMEVFI